MSSHINGLQINVDNLVCYGMIYLTSNIDVHEFIDNQQVMATTRDRTTIEPGIDGSCGGAHIKYTRCIMSIQIENVVSIHDCGEVVTIVMESGSAIHLPMIDPHTGKQAIHLITVMDMKTPDDIHLNVSIDLYGMGR